MTACLKKKKIAASISHFPSKIYRNKGCLSLFHSTLNQTTTVRPLKVNFIQDALFQLIIRN